VPASRDRSGVGPVEHQVHDTVQCHRPVLDKNLVVKGGALQAPEFQQKRGSVVLQFVIARSDIPCPRRPTRAPPHIIRVTAEERAPDFVIQGRARPLIQFVVSHQTGLIGRRGGSRSIDRQLGAAPSSAVDPEIIQLPNKSVAKDQRLGGQGQSSHQHLREPGGRVYKNLNTGARQDDRDVIPLQGLDELRRGHRRRSHAPPDRGDHVGGCGRTVIQVDRHLGRTAGALGHDPIGPGGDGG